MTLWNSLETISLSQADEVLECAEGSCISTTLMRIEVCHDRHSGQFASEEELDWLGLLRLEGPFTSALGRNQYSPNEGTIKISIRLRRNWAVAMVGLLLQ